MFDTQDRTISCQKCGKTFDRAMELAIHYQQYHPEFLDWKQGS
jgi:hypothetical protein